MKKGFETFERSVLVVIGPDESHGLHGSGMSGTLALIGFDKSVLFEFAQNLV